ncbi:MAG: leucyl aminopeptidase family protein [Verrucomicrobiales bacterium]
MKIIKKTLDSRTTKADVLIIFGCVGKKIKLPSGVELPKGAVEGADFDFGQVRVTDTVGGPFQQVILVGLGNMKNVDCERVRRSSAIAINETKKQKKQSITFWIGKKFNQVPSNLGQAIAEGAIMGSYNLGIFRKSSDITINRITFHADQKVKEGIIIGIAIGQGNCFARRLQDTPANKMRPRDMVREARSIAKASSNISLKVIDEAGMKKLGMGSLLSVSSGSAEPAYLIHLTYRPKIKAKKKVCLVGKGLTFDSGGISLKPSARMDEMKYDMSGGAAVLGVFDVLSSIGAEHEIHGLIPTSENLPDAKATKPGDLVKASNGLQIEVLNTDAEGRLILADALCYAEKKIKPDSMIDLATLTGAVVVALGHELTGAMGNDDELINELIDSGKRTSEGVWHLPILDHHKNEMKGSVGDLRNISSPSTGAGSSTGGAFLSYFVGETSWVHLDIAGSAWGATNRDYQGGDKGTGVGVRLLMDYLRNTK